MFSSFVVTLVVLFLATATVYRAVPKEVEAEVLADQN
jgi:hypothetical protein